MLSEREKTGLPYLGGHVLHNIYKERGRINSLENKEAMAVLKCGKMEKGWLQVSVAEVCGTLIGQQNTCLAIQKLISGSSPPKLV